MSLASIRAALETALNAISPALSTAWENQAFTPVEGTPYQIATLMPASAQDPVSGSMHREVGVFHVRILYPLHGGAGTATARAEVTRAAFVKGQSFTSGGVTVRILSTPTVGQGMIDGDRYSIPVRVTYHADIF